MQDIIAQLVGHAADPMIVIDDADYVRYMNTAARTLFALGAHKGDLPLADVLPVRLRSNDGTANSSERNDRRSGIAHRMVNGLRADGTSLFLRASIMPFDSEGGKLFYLIILNEILTQDALQRESHANNQRLDILADLAPIGIFQVDADWNCTYVNSTFCKLAGLNVDELLGRKWVNAIHSNDVSNVLSQFRKSMLVAQEYRGDFRMQTPLGKIHWVSCTARAIFDSAGIVIGYLATLTDMTDQYEAQRNLEYLAHYDSLTGLANRSLFQDRLRQACIRSERHGMLALMFLDLDGFKAINDTLGHDVGDKLLTVVAQRLRNIVRKEDTIARLGGDEFTIVLEGISDFSQVKQVAENLIQSFQAAFEIMDNEIFVTLSIGISACDHSENDPSLLLKEADIAMYHAKAKGRNTYHFFTPELNKASSVRILLANDLHRALDHNEFSLCYQPQVDANSGRVIGVESLLRWPHPSKGMILPQTFIPLMEERGLINVIGEWVITESLKQHRNWMDKIPQALQSHISVNISPKQFWRGDIVASLERALKTYNVPAQQVTLEITENVLIYDNKMVKQALGKLKELGLSIALDDFGTGYSSLSYLKRFPIDQLKIDRSFIRDLMTDAGDSAIAEAVIGLGHALNRRVVAEGVDTLEKAEYLRDMGCDVLQGFYFGEPVVASELDWQQNWFGKGRRREVAAITD